MTTIEIQNREQQLLQRIDGVLRFDRNLGPHVAGLNISFDASRLILDGDLPTAAMIDELVPAIRRAGVLNQVCNNVRVA
ncbi:hypothetical protein [Rubripirellula reticaptiva]|uniref:BON domain-containing protein n=1 Tax=Rubripirellula reticaptiva TaxID=2528013 RepID=A0A5C6EK11_9BACT|nr:hypothetical protein [Rubripirellula reticaptiva]TWU47956.1 hypothetical protein Poly59_48000 [Rubripirellula reticaptiva]